MLEEIQGRPKRPDTTGSHFRTVERVIATIRERLDETISLGQMASVAYMSKFHFNRTFRQVTGVPPRRFLSALRIEAATRMLLNTDRRITDICLDVGYSSLGTFIWRFSSVLGVSPLKLRLMARAPVDVTPWEKEPKRSCFTGTARESESFVKGRIQAPESFSGPIFIGLFRTSIAEGSPVACTVNLCPGSFVLGPVPEADYYLMALGISWPRKMTDYFNYSSALRGREWVSVHDRQIEVEEILLRAQASTDPPILLNLPSLLGKLCAGASPHGREQ